MVNNVFLIEDHDEALNAWRTKKVKKLDLVHLDAHIDFGIQAAKPIEKIVSQAKSIKELKRNLEYSLAFMRYTNDFDKQTNIGNYIYPAMEEGIVNNFYWVIPGSLKEFKESLPLIRNILKNILRYRSQKSEVRSQKTKHYQQEGIITTKFLDRDVVICVLEKLPVLKQKTLLDIDTDFLIVNSLGAAENTYNIGKRKPWILPKDLAAMVKQKIKNPAFLTVAYSVNGGFTPMKYKHLGDELAYHFASEKFNNRLKRNIRAACYFTRFNSTGEKDYYQRAVRLNPTYRATDNNYGPLYLSLRKFSLAKKEFSRILRADAQNPACLTGLGTIALERNDFKKAKKYFSTFLSLGNHGLFAKTKTQGLFGLAKAEFGLKNFKRAKGLLVRYQALHPLEPSSYYLLGCIFEKENNFNKAAICYRDSARLRLSIEPLLRLLKVSYSIGKYKNSLAARKFPMQQKSYDERSEGFSCYLKEKNATIKFVALKYKQFKKEYLRTKKIHLKKGRKIKGLSGIKKKMAALEKMLYKISSRT